MRTTLNLKKEVIDKAVILTGAKNRSQAVNIILEDYVNNKQLQNLLNMKGKLHLEDNLKTLREMELDES